MKAFLLVIRSIWSACNWDCFVPEALFLLTFCSSEFKHFLYIPNCWHSTWGNSWSRIERTVRITLQTTMAREKHICSSDSAAHVSCPTGLALAVPSQLEVREQKQRLTSSHTSHHRGACLTCSQLRQDSEPKNLEKREIISYWVSIIQAHYISLSAVAQFLCSHLQQSYVGLSSVSLHFLSSFLLELTENSPSLPPFSWELLLSTSTLWNLRVLVQISPYQKATPNCPSSSFCPTIFP